MLAIRKRSALIGRISANILLCQKFNALYPREHPRVLASISALREELVRYHQEAGEAFTFDTTDDEVIGKPGKPGIRDLLALRRLLKLNLIRKTTILAEVTEDELFGLCVLLEDGSSRKPIKDSAIEVDPADWEHIVLLFYEPKDLPDGPQGKGTVVLQRAAGVHLVKDLEPMLANLPAESREPIRQIFMKPGFLQKVSCLRQSLRKQGSRAGKAPSAGGATCGIDLIGEIIRLSLPELKREDRKQLSVHEIVSTFQNYMEFVEKNLEILSAEIDSYPGQMPEALELKILEKIQIAPGFSDYLNSLQVQKHRLGVLFRTAPQAREDSGNAAQPTARQSSPASQEAQKQLPGGPGGEAKTEVETPFHEQLEGVRYDGGCFERTLRGSEPMRSYLQVVLELLSRGENREALKRSLPAVIQTIQKEAENPDILEGIALQLADFIGEERFPEAEEILFTILTRSEKPEDLLHLVQDILHPRGGKSLVVSFLDWLVDRDGKKAIVLLSRWSREGKAFLRKLARSRLARLSTNCGLLSTWVADDPVGFLERDSLQSVFQTVPLETIAEAFREFFSKADENHAVQVIQGLPLDIEKAEHIIFPAIDYGPPAVRSLAIKSLRRFPTATVVATLIEIVNRNNLGGEPLMEEVAAALEALASIEDPRAGEFLQKILTHRSWLGNAFHREIRKALQSIRAGSEGEP